MIGRYHNTFVGDLSLCFHHCYAQYHPSLCTVIPHTGAFMHFFIFMFVKYAIIGVCMNFFILHTHQTQYLLPLLESRLLTLIIKDFQYRLLTDVGDVRCTCLGLGQAQFKYFSDNGLDEEFAHSHIHCQQPSVLSYVHDNLDKSGFKVVTNTSVY